MSIIISGHQINETAILLIPQRDVSHLDCVKNSPFLTCLGHPWELYWEKPLKELFSRTIIYDYISRMTEIGLKDVNRELIDLVRKEKPRYVIWPSVNYEFLESTFDQIRNEGTVIVGFFYDDEFRYDCYSKFWIPYLDYCVTSDLESVLKYKETGVGVIREVPCHGVPIDRDWSVISEKYEVSFVGAKKFNREDYVTVIRNAGFPVLAVGSGWGKFVSFDEMLDIFKTSKINLNFTKTEQNKPGWKGRIFQILHAGGFLLTEHQPGIENFFKLGEEIVCFENADDMLEKIRYYLAHPVERRQIAKAGWERARREYTPFQSMVRVFEKIEADRNANQGRIAKRTNPTPMPLRFRRLPAQYYMSWGRAFLLAEHKGLWKDALLISLAYNPYSFRTWMYLSVGILPSRLRSGLINLFFRLRSLLRYVSTKLRA